MAKIAISGEDFVFINGRLLSDFATGDVSSLTYDDDIMTSETGKDGNAVFARNNAGLQANFELRLLQGDADDVFLNGILNQQVRSLEDFTTLTGEFRKRMSNGKGRVSSVNYLMEGGYVSRYPNMKSNFSGDVEQSIVMWTVNFTRTIRTIG